MRSRAALTSRLWPTIFLAPLVSHFLFAQTAQDIVTRAEELLRGSSSKGAFEMTVVTPEFTRTLEMESWWVEKTKLEKDKSLTVMKSPKREEGNKWLKVGNEMWNYLRATETTIKIPPSMMLQSWNGSDFTNDDLARESSMSKDYVPSIIGEELIDGEPCWKLLLLPKPEAAVVWGKLYVWIRRNDMVTSLVQYFDEKGSLVRYMVYSDVKRVGGRALPTTWTMYNNRKEGHRTEFKIVDIAFNIPIPDRIFSLRELERGN